MMSRRLARSRYDRHIGRDDTIVYDRHIGQDGTIAAGSSFSRAHLREELIAESRLDGFGSRSAHDGRAISHMTFGPDADTVDSFVR